MDEFTLHSRQEAGEVLSSPGSSQPASPVYGKGGTMQQEDATVLTIRTSGSGAQQPQQPQPRRASGKRRPHPAGGSAFDLEAQVPAGGANGRAAGSGSGPDAHRAQHDVGASPAPSPPLIKAQSLGAALGVPTPRRSLRMHGDHEEHMAFYPVPRFPPGHTSAAFESMAVRKSLILSPPEIYAECAHHGEEKAQHGWLKMLALTIIAGAYVGFGFSLCLLVGGNIGMDIYRDRPGLFSLVFGAVGFPTGFTFIVICGGELFTSLCAYMASAWWEGKVSAWACLRVWIVSWFGNLAGTSMFVGLMIAAGSYEKKDAFALILASKKTHHSFGSCFVLGIFCNWLVCIATWMSCAAQDMTGKFIAIWLPISAFVMMGFEHVVANQFLLPMAISLGAPLSARDVIVGNLIPTTLGNWVGGAFFVATTYAFAFGRPNKAVTDYWARQRI